MIDFVKAFKQLLHMKEIIVDKNAGFPYIEGQRCEIFHDGEWNPGVIIDGYRFKDGVVTVRLDNGKTVSCGEARKELYRPERMIAK